MKRTSIIFLAVSGLFFTACENTDNKSVKAAQVNPNQQELSEKEKEFLKEVSKDNMLEVELGQMASQKAMSKEVKEFGKHMMSQHKQANNQVEKIAQKKNVMLPDSLGEKGMEKKEDLADLSGKEFEKKYINEMVEQHRKDVNKFEEMAQKAQDPEIKSFAQQSLPTLRNHYMEAQRLDSMVTAREKNKKSTKKTSMK